MRRDLADFGGDIAAAAASAGATTVSPEHVLVDGTFMAEAARAGLPVVPWTVNDPARAAERLREAVDFELLVGAAHWVGDTAHDLLIRAEPRPRL